MGMYTDIHPVLECDLNQLVDKRSTLKLPLHSYWLVVDLKVAIILQL